VIPRDWLIGYRVSEVGSMGECAQGSQICSSVLLQKNTSGREWEGDSGKSLEDE